MNTQNYPSWLVSLEIAKELKEIGFNEPCLIENVETHSEDYSFINFKEEMCSDVSVMLEDVVFVKNQFLEDELGIYKHFVLKTTIPTWEQVLEWFIEKGYIGTINFVYIDKNNFYYKLRINGKCNFIDEEKFTNYEDTREKLINKLIETYKTNEFL